MDNFRIFNHFQMNGELHFGRSFNGLGYPSESNHYLFNGDFVDRGPNSMECLVVMYVAKWLYPNFVFLNRGNHEQKHINQIYGFKKEMLEKYDEELFDFIEVIFTIC